MLVLGTLAALWPASGAVAQPEAIEVRVETGSADGHLRFVPDTFRFERGKYYKLVIHNPSPMAHYFTSDGLATRVFTRKVEFMDGSGKTVAEVHGDIRDMELLPGATLAWFFYPMTKGVGIRRRGRISGIRQQTHDQGRGDTPLLPQGGARRSGHGR